MPAVSEKPEFVVDGTEPDCLAVQLGCRAAISRQDVETRTPAQLTMFLAGIAAPCVVATSDQAIEYLRKGIAYKGWAPKAD